MDTPMKKSRCEWMEERRKVAEHFKTPPWTNLVETMDAFQAGWDAALDFAIEQAKFIKEQHDAK